MPTSTFREPRSAPLRSSLMGSGHKGIPLRTLLASIKSVREELCLLRLRDMQSRQGVMHFRIKGKRDKIRFVPVHPMVQRLIEEYLEIG
jgi:integrase/recombinase XerD